MIKKIKCPLSSHQDFFDGEDLGGLPGYIGFTIAPHGRRLYTMITWCSSGHAMLYYQTPEGLVRRWVNGDVDIIVHIDEKA